MTCASVRLITAACPQLKRLAVLEIAADSMDDMRNVFEYCTNLREVDTNVAPRAFSVVMVESVALHCPNLRVLHLLYCYEYIDLQLLSNVWANCPRLDMISVPQHVVSAVPALADGRSYAIRSDYQSFMHWVFDT